MSDYISREAAVAIADYATDVYPYDKASQEPKTYSEYNKGWNDACVYIRDKLEEENPADVEPVRRWIPCSERLPDLIPCKAGTAYSEKVIVWTTGRKAMVCVWDGKDWFVPYGFWEVWGKDVTHWIPLPKSPEEGDAGNEL